MGCAKLKGGLFANVQDVLFEPAIRSDMSITILREGRFADAQELRIQAAKHSEMCSAVLEGYCFADAQDRVFMMRKGIIWAVPS